MPHFINVDNFLTFKSPDGSQDIALSLKRRNFVKKADEITMILNELQTRTEVVCTAKQFDERHQLIHWYTRIVNNHLTEINLENENQALTAAEQAQIDEMCDAFAKDMMSSKVVNHCIHKYVEENYVNQLDNIEDQTIVNEELQFCDVHAKALLKTSVLAKISVPIILAYVAVNSDIKKLDYAYMFNRVFVKYFKIFEGDFNIINKITKLIESRIKKSIYAHQVIWKYIANTGTDPNLTISNIRRVIITDILPKLVLDKNVVSLFTAVIKNQMDFTFTKKFNLSYKPIVPDFTENESDPFERNENEYCNDEGYKIMVGVDIENSISRLIQQFEVAVDNAKILYYNYATTINVMQKNIIFLTLSKFTRIEYDVFYSLDRKNYIKALIFSMEILKKNGLQYLASMLIATPIPLKRHRFNKKLVTATLSNNIFNNIHDKQFKVLNDRLRNQEVLINKITQIDANTFKFIPSFTVKGLKDFLALNPANIDQKITQQSIKEYADKVTSSSQDEPLNPRFVVDYLRFIQLMC